MNVWNALVESTRMGDSYAAVVCYAEKQFAHRIGIAMGFLTVLSAGVLCFDVVHANADDSQIVKLGTLTFYIPKEWMDDDRFTLSLANGSRMVHRPSDATYVATDLLISTNVPESWRAFGPLIDSPLPDMIDLAVSPGDFSLYEQATRELLAKTRTHKSGDATTAARIWKVSPMRYVVLGSENAFRLGRPLIVEANLKYQASDFALDRIAWARYRISEDVELKMKFDIRDFPPERWMEMDRQVERLVTHLWTPK